MAQLEKQLDRNIREAGRLYLFHFQYLCAVAELVRKKGDIKQAKFLPSEADKRFSTRFYHNAFIEAIRDDGDFERLLEKEQLQSAIDQDMVVFGFNLLAKSEMHDRYLLLPEVTIADDKQIVSGFFTELLWASEDFNDYLEDKFISWDEDLEIIVPRIKKAIKSWKGPNEDELRGDWSTASMELQPESRTFVRELMKVCIREEEALEAMIAPRLENWELDRISLMDRILIRMALAELLHFPTIPVKVSINEYIDISKFYSTPKSKDFINGVLDNLLRSMKEEGLIKKAGRGLVE